jgi:drug/metabolite transporter (DMT)-like permease
MMLGIICAIASSLAYGCADFAGGLATRHAHVLRVVAIASPASFVVELLVLPIIGGTWSASAIGWGAASGVASAAAFILLYQCLSAGPMSVLSPVTALVSAILPVAVGVGLGERLQAVTVIGIVLAMIAVMVVSGTGDGGRGGRPSAASLLLAIGAGAAIAAQLICLNQSPHGSGVTPLIAGRAVSGGTVLIGYAKRRRQLGEAKPQRWLAAGAGALDALANLAFLLAVRTGPLAIIAVITALYPASTVLLARATLKERLAPVQIGGLALAAISVAMLALSR